MMSTRVALLVAWNVVATGIVVLSCMSTSGVKPEAVIRAERLIAEEVEIVRGGRKLAVLGLSVSGPTPGLTMYDSEGSVRLQLSINGKEPELVFYGENGTMRLLIRDDGYARGIRVCDDVGRVIGEFASSENGAWVVVKDGQGNHNTLAPPK